MPEPMAIPAPKCRYCGQEFIPRSARQLQCGNAECVRRFNAERQMDYLRKQRRKSRTQQLVDALAELLACFEERCLRTGANEREERAVKDARAALERAKAKKTSTNP